MKTYSLHFAYLLHARLYKETSLLADFFTYDNGKISTVIKGAKRKNSTVGRLAQPFIPLTISWQGKGPLFTLTNIETRGKVNNLTARRLISGLYLNELIIRLCKVGDAHKELFESYEKVLQDLAQTSDEQLILRKFEKKLLREVGYELSLLKNNDTGEIVEENRYYSFDPEEGPILSNDKLNPFVYKGESLIALATEEFIAREHVMDAKKIMRQVFNFYLGNKPLATRKLFQVKNYS